MSLDIGDLDKIAQIVRTTVRAELGELLGESGRADLAKGWQEARLVLLRPGEGATAKKMPIETFFHKIVMVRDRLRTLEQQINASSKLTDEDKVHLQQYITRIYGSLTTFNVLFRDKADQFVGSSSGSE